MKKIQSKFNFEEVAGSRFSQYSRSPNDYILHFAISNT